MSRIWIDPTEFAAAIAEQAGRGDLDFRTRLLIRDGLDALDRAWGPRRVEDWIHRSPQRERLVAIRGEQLGPPRFPYLDQQLMEATTPDVIRQFLRELGTLITEPAHLAIGGSAALILRSQLSRYTQDIDVVDEVPSAIRSQHDALKRLSQRYRLQLAHFQSHYLPTDWEQRQTYFDTFGPIKAYLVDSYDVLTSKLMSNREKDRDDLRALAGALDKPMLLRRLTESCARLLSEPELRAHAERNWHILYGEQLAV